MTQGTQNVKCELKHNRTKTQKTGQYASCTYNHVITNAYVRMNVKDYVPCSVIHSVTRLLSSSITTVLDTSQWIVITKNKPAYP